ncbi:PAS domain S-box protein [Gelidibacter gilvus]|uniref:histidine kinase n=1 Tax=Gelidibacter gilvus TaxID=59602 RepID=A0A4Q0XDW8_9FLAO|nr:PAS domain S-box protein [Gelidibacter gilvus]RXJ45718.1 PAS domain S-box protein [Gelidibacter gilvus]
MMTKILILESATNDLNFICFELDRSGFNYTTINIKLIDEFENAVHNYNPDIILSGYSLMNDNGQEVLKICDRCYPLIPLILIADHIEIENCVALIKNGVSDIILKQNIASLGQKISTTLKTTRADTLPNQCEENLNDKSIYRSLIENSEDAILLTEKDGKILEANNSACQIFKMTEEEFYIFGRFSLVDHNDPSLLALIEERNLTGVAKDELTFNRKDGSSFTGEITSVVFKDIWGHEMTSIKIKDLTQYKKAEKQLAKTAAELQETVNSLNKIMNASMDLIFSVDADKKIVQINSACNSTTGYETQELVGKSYIDFIHNEDKEIIFNADQNVRNGNPIKTFEARVIHKNGTTIYILLSAQWDEDDKLIYCTAKDITEKTKLEKAYKVERERFLDLYNLAPACMGLLKGPNHIHELTNSLYLKFINKKDVIGKSILEVMPEMEDQGIIGLLDSVYNTGVPFIANEMLIQLDSNNNGLLVQTYMNFIYQAHRKSDGKIDGIFVFAIDVTEQVLSRIKIEESEKMYRQLISELPVAAYSCDADGKISFFNKAAAILWDTEPKIGEDSFCGFSKMLDEDGQTIPLHLSPMAISLNEGRIVSGRSGTVERASGERRYVLPHVVPYIDSSGKVTGAVNVVTDITEIKVAQIALELRNSELAFQNQEKEKRAAELSIANKELAYQNKEKENRANELVIANQELAFQNDEKEKRAKELILINIELHKSNKELDRFVYSISHDLRSPLTSVQGLVSIIEEESEEPSTLKHVEMIKNSINRLDEFVKKILIYSRNDRTDLELEIIPVKKTILNIIASLQNMKQAKDIHFEIEVQELSPFCTDKLRFNTIVENLISNAIKYHKPRSSDRFIKVKAVAHKEMMQLEIVDNGIGIPLMYKEKIFDMFFRISSKSEGSGIGLYIVKDTIEKLEGSIKVISQKQAGTTFEINLKNYKKC